MPFSDATFAFLGDLAAHNDRDWFKANQDRFEGHVRTPALDFIDEAAGWLEATGHPWRGEAKKVGGALSRIHRDTRFSNDKTPYHTHITMHFHHKDATAELPGPVLGVRFAVDDVGMGAGVYGGDTPTLNRIRDAIVADPDGWSNARAGRELWGDTLKTAPKGYDKDHPLIEDIRRKAWMTSASFDREDLLRRPFAAFQAGVAELKPFTEWMARAMLR